MACWGGVLRCDGEVEQSDYLRKKQKEGFAEFVDASSIAGQNLADNVEQRVPKLAARK
jgi:hypothetical protein